MFLFISTNSPVTSLISVVFFLATCALSSPLSRGVLPIPVSRQQLTLACVLLSAAAIVWALRHGPIGPPAAGGAARQPHQARQAPLDAGALRTLIHRLPLEPWLCSESRATLGVRELRERLHRRRVPTKGLVERCELVDALEGSPHETLCAICYDNFADGEELRMLPCNHAFHIECVDRWLLDCGANRRSVACPLCNTPLDTAAAAAATTARAGAEIHGGRAEPPWRPAWRAVARAWRDPAWAMRYVQAH